jgi:glycosyltransferase involved in cell wall biosynthesis
MRKAKSGLISTKGSRLREWRETFINRIVESFKWRLGIKEFDTRFAAIEKQLGEITPSASVWAVTHWIEQSVLEKTPLVSVILPTHNRSRLLRRAVASVVAQDYTNWEIIIVDDGSRDDTPAVIDQLKCELGEKKLRTMRISPSGVCAARNHALRAARGSYISYLDDDNTMHRLWLKAVVWAFSQRPDVDVLYGGIIIDDKLRINRKSRGALPAYYLNSFDRQRLVSDNLADIGVIAHRSGIAEAYFDESLREMGDWDLLVRLTRSKPPLVLPVLACFYSTEEADRLSGGPTFEADAARVREKANK